MTIQLQTHCATFNRKAVQSERSTTTSVTLNLRKEKTGTSIERKDPAKKGFLFCNLLNNLQVPQGEIDVPSRPHSLAYQGLGMRFSQGGPVDPALGDRAQIWSPGVANRTKYGPRRCRNRASQHLNQHLTAKVHKR